MSDTTGKNFKRYFEANLLDGDAIQGGQLIASGDAFSVSNEYIQAKLKAIKESLPVTKPYGKDTPDEYTEQWNDGFNEALGQVTAIIDKELE